ncbi:CGNR zinc finger domain-containing protein [Phyllobacterium sp. BT25]|uniref:CGNR zinc finger domain-containing protein n=1 Tax=Phyllobacterium pellucidum TaxID=2740464 RepID=A0A849VRL2_9HYPH|nr:CGNR zinc finger domain-containing protein [Phyllobacterium pellucidum]NTS32206.1 CGNR zinc finger domain-containing protein [Phyllobacterium pellucidum]
MTFEWNAHRFSGGVLALDLANTVVFRESPERSLDRFSDPAEVTRFAAAAADFRQGEWGNVKFRPPLSEREITGLIDMREAINRLFRTAVHGGGLSPAPLSEFLRLGSKLVGDEPGDQALALPRPSRDGGRISLAAASFLSGVRLFEPLRLERIKVCPNCHWLYFDESRNRSRRWCDMNVCGNRAKARRYYDRNAKQMGSGHG